MGVSELGQAWTVQYTDIMWTSFGGHRTIFAERGVQNQETVYFLLSSSCMQVQVTCFTCMCNFVLGCQSENQGDTGCFSLC